ncbi:MAG: serine hydrolase domain-containing protein [Terricaulis sp.]
MWDKLKLLAAPVTAALVLGAFALSVDAKPATPVAAVPAPAATAAAPQMTPEDLNAWLDGYVPQAITNGDIVGTVVTVVRNGQVIANRGYGYADLAHHTPVDPNATLFRPGSVSKLFTWTAVMQLVEQKKLDLDADVNTYLDFRIPDYQGKPLTLRNIMTHTSGFQEVVRDLIVTNSSLTLEQYLRANMPARIYAPGTMPAYSNYATALAGYIIQRVSGEQFPDYIQHHIFDPLGMQHSTFHQPLPQGWSVNASLGYKNGEDGKPQDFEIIPAAPAGSLSTTGSDMARFMIAHLNHGAGLLQPQTADMMHSYRDRQFPVVESMALGFYHEDLNGQNIIAHGGDTQWFHSNVALLLDQNIGVFISVNSVGGNAPSTHLLRWQFMQALMDRYYPAPRPADPAPLPTARAHGAQVVGDYESSRRSQTNPLLAVYFAGQTTVGMLPNGDLVGFGLPDANGAPKHWREVSPFVWKALGSHDRMSARVENGIVTAIAYEPLSFAIEDIRAPWYRSKSLLLPLLCVALAILALTLVSWPVRALVRKAHSKPFPYEGARALAHRLGPAVSLVTLLHFFGWVYFIVWLMGSLSNTASSASSGPLTLLYLGAVLPLAALLGTLWLNLSLWRGGSTWFAKIWGVLLLASVLVMLWFAYAVNFFSFNYAY